MCSQVYARPPSPHHALQPIVQECTVPLQATAAVFSMSPARDGLGLEQCLPRRSDRTCIASDLRGELWQRLHFGIGRGARLEVLVR